MSDIDKLREALAPKGSVAKMAERVPTSDSVWKWLAVLFGGIIIGFLTFWFGGGQSEASITAQTATTLVQVQKVQDAQETQIDNVNGRMEAMAEILSTLKQEVHDDEQFKAK